MATAATKSETNATELTRALERGEVAPASFHHASHLQVAWIYLQESDSIAGASDKMSVTLRKLAGAAGHPEKYHETITIFWIRILANFRNFAGEQDLDRVLAANPALLAKDFVLKYYSQDLLLSDRARTSWVEPDLKPLSI